MTAKSSANLQPALMKLYRGQMNAFQLAITNFVEGYREGAAEKADLSKVFQGMSSEQKPVSQAPRGAEAEPDSEIQASLQQSGASEIGSSDTAELQRAPQKADPRGSKSRASHQQHSLATTNLEGLFASRHQQAKADNSPVSRAAEDIEREHTSEHTGSMSQSGRAATPSKRIESKSPKSNQRSEGSKPAIMMPGHSNSQEPRSSGSSRQPRREDESPQVVKALGRAEDLARALLQPGGVTEKRRKELEAAISEAEAAMSQVSQKVEKT